MMHECEGCGELVCLIDGPGCQGWESGPNHVPAETPPEAPQAKVSHQLDPYPSVN